MNFKGFLLLLTSSLIFSTSKTSTIGDRGTHDLFNSNNPDVTPREIFLSPTNTSPATLRTSTETCIDCPRQASCVPFVHCPAHVRETNIVECHLKTGKPGVCCSTGQNHTNYSEAIKPRIASIDGNSLHMAVVLGQKKYKQILNQEANLIREGRSIVKEGTPSYEHYRSYRVSNSPELDKAQSMANKAMQVALATKVLSKREAITTDDIEDGLNGLNLHGTPLKDACLHKVECDMSSPYRTIDGSCNNVEKPHWGMLATSYSRLLPPSYADGVWSPRVSISGVPLPSPRKISTGLFIEKDKPDQLRTLLLMQFGQFISHDLTKQYVGVLQNGSGISCCSYDGTKQVEYQYRHEYCMPIYVEESDVFYKDFGQACMNFVRSFLALRPDCTLGYSEQMNIQTHFLDGSMIYGADVTTSNGLREFQGGRLTIHNDYGRDLLPSSAKGNNCLMKGHGAACYIGGDSRINQFLLLTVMHLLFVREHNRIANQLSALNPHWNDETIFQEARRIVVAELQHITYNEFLPVLLGEDVIDDFNLRSSRDGYSGNYDPNMDPSILNEFAAAVFRLHTLVDRKIIMYEEDDLEELIEISDAMEFPSKLRRRKFFDNALNTLTLQCMQKYDSSFAEGLTRYMFHGGNPYGTDLTSLNIQRGRDHGLRPYNDYRELIGLPKITNWNQYPEQHFSILQRLYESPEDMDLFVGASLEPKDDRSVLGATAQQIIAEQFQRTRQGDRYFYEYGPDVNPGAFSIDQLEEIKKVTIAQLICDNSDHILLKRQALNSFLIPSETNEYVDCESPKILRMDLTKWSEPIVTFQ